MTRHGIRTAFTGGAVVLALLTTGCSDSGSAADEGSGPGPDPKTRTQRIGAAGGVCELPFTFEAPAGWKVAPASAEAMGGFTMGMAELVCELDARHAGVSGFVRLWNDPTQSGTSRLVLEGFVSESPLKKVRNVEYREVKAGPYEAVEVSYEGDHDLWGDGQKERHLAFETAKGFTVIDIDAQHTPAHGELLPEYERIRKTLRES
ncbi:lipoprotein [Streptomyces tsukubensis]|uniref:lipoprotein n=1 Tax=Streptomyces tsukubensis TaxID=83656 RepID=UPI00344D9133